MSRPAESAGIATALALDNDDTITGLAIVIGFVPAAITWLVVLLRKK
jgi:hypothetical protein